MKRTGFIAGILISALLFFSHPLVLFTPFNLLLSLFPIAFPFFIFFLHPLSHSEPPTPVVPHLRRRCTFLPDVVGAGNENSDHRLQEASGGRGLGGGRCLSGTSEDARVPRMSPAVSARTHKCTGSAVLPVHIIFSPLSRKCAVQRYDRWAAFRDGAAPTVCLSLLRMDAE